MQNLFKAVLALFILINAVSAYTVHIEAPAVIVNADQGVLTSISLNVTTGNGTVSVTTGSNFGTVGNDTIQSAKTAATYAASYLNLNQSKYNFNYTIHSNESNVSGPSAGLAMTLLAFAGLQHRQLNPDFSVTGTINPNGSVGPIGGVFDKIQAAKSINAKYFLAPYLNPLDYQYLLYYLSQQTYNVPVIEIRNASDAFPYAFGNPNIVPLNYTVYRNYMPSGLPAANSVCSSCNESAFSQLSNFTQNFTESEINGLDSSKFASIKTQLQNQLAQYAIIDSKGYQYSAADLAFVAYPTSFVFSHYQDSNTTTALAVLNNVSSYCQSVNASPQMTNKNYEYVIGGQARHIWAEITLNAAYSALNQSQTSDEVLAVLEATAPAYSWCLATGEMYKIAASQGGNPIEFSTSISSQAQSALAGIQKYGAGQIYVNATKQAYQQGQYAAALYSAEYANVFYNNTAIIPLNNTVNSAVTKALSAPNGIWPQQFALQSQFYLYQSSVMSGINASQARNDAYTTALLSMGLGNVNADLQSNFIAPSQAQNQTGVANQMSQINSNIQLIFQALIILTVLILIILITLVLHMTSHRNMQQPSTPPQRPVQQSSMQTQAPKSAARRVSTKKKDPNA